MEKFIWICKKADSYECVEKSKPRVTTNSTKALDILREMIFEEATERKEENFCMEMLGLKLGDSFLALEWERESLAELIQSYMENMDSFGVIGVCWAEKYEIE